MQVFILSAGAGENYHNPTSLHDMPSGMHVLDWQIATFSQSSQKADICVLVGHRFEKVVQQYPQLNFALVPNWENETALDTLLAAPFEKGQTAVITYGDTVFRSDTVEQFLSVEADVVVGIDTSWEHRFVGRSTEDRAKAETLSVKGEGVVEFTGLLKLCPAAVDQLTRVGRAEIGQTMLDLLEYLRAAGFSVSHHDVAGDWAELNDPADMAHFVLGTKAETLARLRGLVRHSLIADQYTCTWSQWCASKADVVAAVIARLGRLPLIVRSSSSLEDGWSTSNAGGFDSFLDVDGNDPAAIQGAIEGVFASYSSVSPDAQVLLQPFLSTSELSGVLFTCDLDTGAPYYIANFDDRTGSTSSVTAGDSTDLRVVVTSSFHPEAVQAVEPRLSDVLQAAEEIQTLLNYRKLDIEFAVDHDGQVHVFQVRPIVVDHEAFAHPPTRLLSFLEQAQNAFASWQKPAPHIVGSNTILSNMADWNPAEIIGVRPDPLALSLYQTIITDDIWARQRREFGYRDVAPAPLIHNLELQPYVDVRSSLNSFVPACLSDTSAARIVDAYLNCLGDSPTSHDKIEFDVAFTVWTSSFHRDAVKRLSPHGVTLDDIAELEKGLKSLTRTALQRLDDDVSTVGILGVRRSAIRTSNMARPDQIYALIDDCRRFGTLAFSHAARAGFVATTLLKSFVADGTLTEDRMLAFLASLDTVAGEFEHALASDMTLARLGQQFGHLRPGTYDVTKQAYWENPKLFFARGDREANVEQSAVTFSFTSAERRAMAGFLDALGSDIGVDALVAYLGQAIVLRESTKFEFTRSLSLALDLIWQHLAEFDISRQDAAWLTWQDLVDMRVGVVNIDNLRAMIETRQTNSLRDIVKLPALIRTSTDIVCFEQPTSVPNFITRKSVIGNTAVLDDGKHMDLEGKIILIPNADPGFDWLFGRNIGGLITQFGGANSHMAIRSAETSLPAAIGVGDKIYDRICRMEVIELNCLNETIVCVKRG